MARTARLTQRGDALVQELHLLTGKPRTEIIESALESYRHQERMYALNASFKKLKSDPEKWEEEQDERAALEGTLMDGLDDEEA